MEDGPKLLPQWLRGSSSGLHQRGDFSDASKRGKPAVTESTRQPSHSDTWIPRPLSGAPPSNGATGKQSLDFNRAPEWGTGQDRSWKPRDNGFPVAQPRSNYVPATQKSAGRDDRDAVALKSAGSYGSGRAYARPGESEGSLGANGRRLDRAQDSWPLAQPHPAGSSRVDGDGRAPVQGGAANAGAAVPTKAAFDKEFPSLRPTQAPAPSPSPSGPAPASATTSTPMIAASPSPLLDTSSSTGTGTTSPAVPYRQTFLSSRTNSNWTSKLAEAPVVPHRVLPATPSFDEEVGAAPPPAAATPMPLGSASIPVPVTQATAPVATASVPTPVVPPRPSGVWGNAAVAAADSGPAHNGAAVAASATSRARLEQIAVRQSKQLIPVLSSGGSKAKMGAGCTGGAGLGGSAGAAAMVGTSSRAAGGGHNGGVPKPVTAGMLRIAATKRSDDVAVMLSKKASQPLGKPLTLMRTTSAIAATPASALTAPAPLVTGSLSPSPSADCLAAQAGGVGGEVTSAMVPLVVAVSVVEGPPAPQAPHAAIFSGETASHTALCAPVALQTQTQTPNAMTEAALQVRNEVQSSQEALASHLRPTRPSRGVNPALQVSEEEEAFLRSLGWTGFDEDDDEEGDTGGLTEEEIASFRAQQQRQATVAGAACAGMGPLAAGPKPVPGVVAACRRVKPLIVAASYGSEPISSSTDSDSECE